MQQIERIPYSICRREPDYIEWSTEYILPLLESAAERRLGIVKFHRHPGGYPHPSRPSAMTYCFFSSLKTLLTWTRGMPCVESVATVPLLILDDFGMRKLPHTAAEDPF